MSRTRQGTSTYLNSSRCGGCIGQIFLEENGLVNQLTASAQILSVQAPVIPEVSEWIKKVPDTISLGQGVVFYGPPTPAIEAAVAFCSEPCAGHRYGAVDGEPELLLAIEEKLLRENAISIDRENAVVVTAGSNMAFMHVLMAILEPGDEIILPLPYYFNHEMAVRMLGGVPISVPCRSDYQLDLDRIRSAMTARTRAVVTVSPNNPTGVIYREQDLRVLNSLCGQLGVFHISDEAYEYFTYDGLAHFSPAAIPGSERHTLSLFSLSKSFGFAGWRIGYMVIPQFLKDSIMKIQDTQLICPPLVSQRAATAAMVEGKRYSRPFISQLDVVRSFALERLTELPSLTREPISEGAFYLWLSVNSELDSFGFARKLVEQFRVAVIPGAAFGFDEGCTFRMSFGALEPEMAMTGIDRLAKGIAELGD